MCRLWFQSSQTSSFPLSMHQFLMLLAWWAAPLSTNITVYLPISLSLIWKHRMPITKYQHNLTCLNFQTKKNCMNIFHVITWLLTFGTQIRESPVFLQKQATEHIGGRRSESDLRTHQHLHLFLAPHFAKVLHHRSLKWCHCILVRHLYRGTARETRALFPGIYGNSNVPHIHGQEVARLR